MPASLDIHASITMICRNNRAGGSLKLVAGICVFLIVLTWLVFGQTLGHQFVNYDDPKYVYQNPEVTRGLSLHGIGWAFTHIHSRNWHPLTSISHMLDCQLYGLKAGGHHCTNVVLHTFGVVLLFLVLRETTGTLWCSAFVAALFAIHPLHVESVAWVSERKDVLSGVFFMLTLAAYVRYVRKRSLAIYLLVALLFALGLMSKPMLVTLPFVLLLLDYWPLNRALATAGKLQSDPPMDGFAVAKVRCQRIEGGRLETQNVSNLILEKLPLVLLSVASCLVTLVVQRRVIGAMQHVHFLSRMINALLSYLAYVYEMFWPARLAVFYPYPFGPVSVWLLTAAVLVLCIITVGVFKLRQKYPYLLTGWFWYLVMSVPVIGIIQVGGQARADRYTYLPHIGLYLAVTWAASDLFASWRHRREILATAAATAIVALAWCAHLQASYWKNSESLWIRTLSVTSNNANAHINLGSALLEKGLIPEAISHYQRAVALDPALPQAHRNLGRALFQQGDVDKAIMHWRKTLSIDPDDAEAHIGLGDGLMQKGLTEEAIAHYERSLQIESQPPALLNGVAWLLSTFSEKQFRNGARAVELARQADEFAQGKDPIFIRTLAAAYAESGRFNDAIAAAQRALKLAQAKGDSTLANKLQMDIDLYRMNFPLR